MPAPGIDSPDPFRGLLGRMAQPPVQSLELNSQLDEGAFVGEAWESKGPHPPGILRGEKVACPSHCVAPTRDHRPIVDGTLGE
jgi:hypothetical protein